MVGKVNILQMSIYGGPQRGVIVKVHLNPLKPKWLWLRILSDLSVKHKAGGFIVSLWIKSSNKSMSPRLPI